MPHMRDGLASARSAWPVRIHADVHIPAVCVHVTKPRLKAVADRCCDRHNPLNHLARAIRLQEHTYRVVWSERCSEEANRDAEVNRDHLVHSFVSVTIPVNGTGQSTPVMLP
jgi:hypothetical protein